MTLSNAERQARWREKQRARLAALEAAAVQNGDQPPPAAQPTGPASATVEASAQAADTTLQARIVELKTQNAELKKRLAAAPISESTFPRSKEELLARHAQAQEEKRLLREAQRAQRGEKRAKKGEKLAAEADPELTREELLVRLEDRDRQIKGLQTQLKNERGKIRSRIAKGTMLSKAGRKLLLTCLHPDRGQTEKEKKNLTNAFAMVENMPYDSD